MATKQRSRQFRRDHANKDKAKRGKGNERRPKTEAYDRNRRAATKAQLRNMMP